MPYFGGEVTLLINRWGVRSSARRVSSIQCVSAHCFTPSRSVYEKSTNLDVLMNFAVSLLNIPRYRESSPVGAGIMFDDLHSGLSSPSTIWTVCNAVELTANTYFYCTVLGSKFVGMRFW